MAVFVCKRALAVTPNSSTKSRSAHWPPASPYLQGEMALQSADKKKETIQKLQKWNCRLKLVNTLYLLVIVEKIFIKTAKESRITRATTNFMSADRNSKPQKLTRRNGSLKEPLLELESFSANFLGPRKKGPKMRSHETMRRLISEKRNFQKENSETVLLNITLSALWLNICNKWYFLQQQPSIFPQSACVAWREKKASNF